MDYMPKILAKNGVHPKKNERLSRMEFMINILSHTNAFVVIIVRPIAFKIYIPIERSIIHTKLKPLLIPCDECLEQLPLLMDNQ